MSNKISYKDISRFALHYWKKNPLLGIGAAIFLMASVAVDIFVPLYTGKIVNAMVTHNYQDAKGVEEVIRYAFIFVGMAFLHYFFWMVAFKLWNKFAVRNLYAILTDATAKVQRFSSEWHANSFAGATVRKITRGMWSFDIFEDTLFMGFIPAFVIMIGMTVMISLQLPLVGAFVAVMIFLLILSSVLMAVKILAPLFHEAAKSDTQVGATIADIMTGIPTVKSFAAEKREDSRFNEIAVIWQKRAVRSWQTAATMDFVRSMLRLTILAGMVGLTIFLWMNGKANPGDVALAITGSFMIGGYLRDIGRHVAELQKSASEIEDVVSFWLRADDIQDAPGAMPLELPQQNRGDIVFENVNFAYRQGGQRIYDGLSVHIRSGEKIALVGMSGSGKTTFIKLIQRLYDIDSGRILIDGQNIANVTQESLRQAIALVPQEPILFHRSLAENIAYGKPDASYEEIEQAARQAYAHEFIVSLQQGYDTLVGERGVKLSGGERQRVAIARAILADKPILILDEATSSLDSVSEHYIQLALERLMQGRTTITVAHRLATIQNADRILVFDKGRIIEEGSHQKLLSRQDSRYYQLYNMQMLDISGEETG